jgi:hypothetical protein
MADLALSDKERDWLVEAIAELFRLRGWAWGGEEWEAARGVIEALGENADNVLVNY